MAAYTLSQFITQAASGGAVSVSSASPNSTVCLEIGNYTVILSDKITTKEVDGTNNIKPITITESDTRTLDLGTLFSANEVLESISLRKAISDGTVTAVEGTVALSKVPTV